MIFKRTWDSSCPRVWDQWEADGKKWVVQDLAPEDDERAVEILMTHLVPDEPLCMDSGILNDPVSMKSIREIWEHTVPQRMTLGCYTEVDGKMTLVALNACVVGCKGEENPVKIEGDAWKNVYGVLAYLEEVCSPFKRMGLDRVLEALGLVVMREYRGHRLGGRLLAAREPLCRSQGIKGTSTVFTGPASQKLAAMNGFFTAKEVTYKELVEEGFKYPETDRVIKLMMKKYD